MTLDADLTLASSDALISALRDALDQGHEIVLDATQVQRIDLAVLQQLLAFVREAHRRRLEVTFRECSEVFARAVRVTGLAQELGLSA